MNINLSYGRLYLFFSAINLWVVDFVCLFVMWIGHCRSANLVISF